MNRLTPVGVFSLLMDSLRVGGRLRGVLESLSGTVLGEEDVRGWDPENTRDRRRGVELSELERFVASSEPDPIGLPLLKEARLLISSSNDIR